MKFAKLLALILVISTLCCMFVACDNDGDDIDVDLPERDFYDITVSFQIKDSTGKTIVDARDYNYKSHSEPTMLNIVDTYLSVVQNWTCKIDKNNTLTQVGGTKANKSTADFWGFVNGAIDLSKEQIKDDLSDGRMSDTMVEDGGKFTIMLIVGEE